VTPRGGGFDFRHVVKVRYLHSSHGPDQQLQRWQRVYQQLGVQQALVLFQINRKRSRFNTSLLKIY
jgi:hypothetical protein